MLPSFSKSALALVNRAFRLSAVAAAADRFLLLLPPLPFSLSSEDEEDPLPSSEILLTEDAEEADAEAEAEAALAAEEAVVALALSTSMEILGCNSIDILGTCPNLFLFLIMFGAVHK